MDKERKHAVKLTAKEWGRICRLLMDSPKDVDLHMKIYDSLPYLK